MALAMSHVMLREVPPRQPAPVLRRLCPSLYRHANAGDGEERDGYYAAGRMLRAADLVDSLGQENNRNGKPSPLTATVNNWRQTVQLVSAGAKRQMEPRTARRDYRCETGAAQLAGRRKDEDC